jgi:hypothetical protein
MTSVGSFLFCLFGAFGNNAFSSFVFSSGGNPYLNQPNPMKGFVPSQGMMEGTTSFLGLGNLEQGFIPMQGMPIRGNPSHA